MRALPTLLAALALAGAAACSPDGDAADPADDESPATTTAPDDDPNDDPGDDSGDGGGSTGSGSGTGRFPRALAPFADCSNLLDHIKSEARNRVGPYGLDDGPWYVWAEGDVAAAEAGEDSGDAGGLAAADDASTVGGEFTGTNVQEAGIDEPDIVKTDGQRILAVSENRLAYVDINGEPRVTDTITIPEGWGHEMFIRGDRALLFTNGGSWAAPMPVDVLVDDIAVESSGEFFPGDGFGPAALIVEVDLSDPDDLQITGSIRIEGQYLSARAIDDRVRLAVTSPPTQLPWLYPQNENGEDRATEANRQIVDESSLDDWLPSYELQVGDVASSGQLLDCDRAHRPAEFAGFDMISIVDLDLDDGLAGASTLDAVGVLAGGQTIYSSTDRFYVATTKWVDQDTASNDSQLREWSEDFETDLHAFAISADEPTRYVASGTTEGSLLNQFSMDEHEGFLRVITTDGSPWGPQAESETQLVVYEEQREQLVEVGRVGGLGRGEQLFSARLMGDVGFAVTFRQIDPFYVLDLSDPRNPQVTGELKIPGVSTYLHPVGENLVLGIGQNATDDGMVTGFKMSLFDVSNPADPREVSVWTMDDANSPAEWDHRAFQMSGSTAIVPVQQWNGDFNGAILFDIGERITEIGRVTHVRPDAQPTSDCRVIEGDELTPEGSELWWMATDGYGRVQLCEPDATGGWGTWYCDPIPVEQLEDWYGNADTAAVDLATIGAEQGDRIEICWPDGGYEEAIQRSLVVDDTLWTTAFSTIQANRLDGLDVVTQLSLR